MKFLQSKKLKISGISIMPIRRFRRRRNMRKKLSGGRRGIVRGRRLVALNPAPVFTETYTLTSLTPNAGGVFRFSMDQIPQLAQYSGLYQKYRIIRASVHLLPEYNSFEQNQAESNAALSRTYFGLSRVAWATNDTPNTAAPTSEAAVLQDNGARVKALSTGGIRMSCRPVPSTNDSNNVAMTFSKKYINFNNSGPNIAHSGIAYWLTQQVSGGAPQAVNVAIVYVKLTFQLADPR